MPASPIDIKLRCKSWAQVSSMYNRDLVRGALFIRASNPPPVGTEMRIQLLLPSQTLIVLNGSVTRHIGPGELDGRGPGVDVTLHDVPQDALWLIESALQSARTTSSVARPLPKRPARSSATASRTTTPASPPNPAAPTERVSRPSDLDMTSGLLFVTAEHELLGALQKELESLRGLNAYQVLGVSTSADQGSIRAAFAELTKRYHPDLYTRYQNDKIRALAAEIFIAIRNAYDALDRASRRRQVAAGTERSSTTRVAPSGPAATPAPAPQPRARPTAARKPPPAPTPAQAQTSNVTPVATPEPAKKSSGEYERRTGGGYDFLDRGEYSQAHGAFILARRRDPDDPIVRAGVELAEGLIALEAGDRLEAAQRFEVALEIDPRNQQAAEHLTEIRRRATAERKKFLARLMEQRE